MMTRHNKLVQWMLALVAGVFLAAFSYGACTAQAAETTVEAAQEQDSADSSAENGGGAMILLMGGMLIIILAVVLSVVGTFVSSAAEAANMRLRGNCGAVRRSVKFMRCPAMRG